MLDITERHRRGELCFVGSKRCVQANNGHIDINTERVVEDIRGDEIPSRHIGGFAPDTFNEDLHENYVIYLDANYLHGWAMTEALHTNRNHVHNP